MRCIKKIMVGRMAKGSVALAVMVAPFASSGCRMWFYEEKGLDGFDEFVKKC